MLQQQEKLTHRTNKGFSLVELMGSIVILGVLMSFLIPNVVSSQIQAQEAYITAHMHKLKTAAEIYASQWQGAYPQSVKQLKPFLYSRKNSHLDDTLVMFVDGQPDEDIYEQLKDYQSAGVVAYHSNGKIYQISGYSQYGQVFAGQSMILSNQKTNS